MAATAGFLLWGSAIAVHLYYFSAQTYRYWPWHIASVVAALLLVKFGAYPPFFPRGDGFWTPNRTVGLLLYVIAFNGSIMAGALRFHITSFNRQYEDWLDMKRRYVWQDHRP